jgi:CRP-like cAMP-binding protein
MRIRPVANEKRTHRKEPAAIYPLSGHKGTSDLAAFSEVCRVQIVPESGNFAYRQGDESEVFYVIAIGEAEMVLERGDGGTSIVGRIGPGGHFGETGMLTGKPRS